MRWRSARSSEPRNGSASTWLVLTTSGLAAGGLVDLRVAPLGGAEVVAVTGPDGADDAALGVLGVVPAAAGLVGALTGVEPGVPQLEVTRRIIAATGCGACTQ